MGMDRRMTVANIILTVSQVSIAATLVSPLYFRFHFFSIILSSFTKG